MNLDNFSGYKYAREYLAPSERLDGDRIHNLNVHLAYHCNLNCKYCLFFSPCADPVLPDSKELEKDLIQLSKLTQENPIDHLFLMGGEPLLNPDLIYFMDLSRKLFPKTTIYVYTNGLLVEKQSNIFWKSLTNNKIILLLSRYFEDESFYENILKIADDHDAKDLVAYSKSANGVSLFIKNQLKINNPGDFQENCNKCPFKNSTVSLNKGKLYSCQISSLLYILKNKFHLELDINDNDGIDIYSNTYNEIISHLKKPQETCKYCNDDAFKCLYFPERSEFKREEWIKD